MLASRRSMWMAMAGLTWSAVEFGSAIRGIRVKAKWERLEFAKNAAGAHDIIAADIDGDGRADIVMMSDANKPLNALCWFGIPPDPRSPWTRHEIGPGHTWRLSHPLGLVM
jgi:hypothetical protein